MKVQVPFLHSLF